MRARVSPRHPPRSRIRWSMSRPGACSLGDGFFLSGIDDVKRLSGGADLDDPQEYSRAVVATSRVKELTRDSEPSAVGRSELRPQ